MVRWVVVAVAVAVIAFFLFRLSQANRPRRSGGDGGGPIDSGGRDDGPDFGGDGGGDGGGGGGGD